jgi:uncharacterized protein (DUF924 family)
MTPQDVLSFWMGDGKSPRAAWFQKSDAFDESIRSRFEDAIDRASSGLLDAWADGPWGALALVVLLDQMSRNAFRGTPRSFAYDVRAREIATRAIDAGHDAQLAPLERAFLYMPLVHAEDRASQARAVALFEVLAASAPAELADYFKNSVKFARLHRDIVDRFGRFPHRNAVLGRASTPEEVAFLKEPGSSF